MKAYTLIDRNTMREAASIAKPRLDRIFSALDGAYVSQYQQAIENYNAHVATLPTYKLTAPAPAHWEELIGKEGALIEGVHFKREAQCNDRIIWYVVIPLQEKKEGGEESTATPILIKSGDDRIQINGKPPLVDCRIVAEDYYQKLQSQLTEAREQIANIEEELSSVNNSWRRTMQTSDELQIELNAAREQLKEKDAEIERLKGAIDWDFLRYMAKENINEISADKDGGVPFLDDGLRKWKDIFSPADNMSKEPNPDECAAATPQKVCYCGSLRVAIEAFKKVEYESVMKGEIALLPCCMYVDIEREYGANSDYKIKADELHKRKIDLCDKVVVLNVGGYIGSSTHSEIEYAQTIGKPIEYLEAFTATQADRSDEAGNTK